MLYNNKQVEIKFDNLTSLRFLTGGVSIGNLLITETTDISKFCKAWSLLLGVECTDERAFLNGFKTPLDASEINAEVISALERDGVIAKDSEAKKKKVAKKKK